MKLDRQDMSPDSPATLEDFDDQPPLIGERNPRRTRLRLEGRYMLPDRREFRCYTGDISAEGALIYGPETCEPGAQVVVYLDRVGALEGEVTWSHPNRFAVRFLAPPRKASKVAQKLDELLRWEEARIASETELRS